MSKENAFATKLGQFVGNMLVACIAICIAACAIALTVRFVTWLF